jgi:hypothetical protein
MTRSQAWIGFYKNLKQVKQAEKEIKDFRSGATKTLRLWEKTDQMAKLRMLKYGKSLVFEHGWQDVHTCERITAGRIV